MLARAPCRVWSSWSPISRPRGPSWSSGASRSARFRTSGGSCSSSSEEDEQEPPEVLNLADLDAPLDQLGPRGLDIGDHELQTLHGARASIRDPFPECDGTGRPGRRQLHDAERIADPAVMVHMEADLL